MSARPGRDFALALLLAGNAAFIALAPAQAQRADKPSPQDRDIIVNGVRAPNEKDPAFMQCLRLAKSTHYRGLTDTIGPGDLKPTLFLSTRLPRNPDYSKPPSVAAGSPVTKVSLNPRYTRSRKDLMSNRTNASQIAGGVDTVTISSGSTPSPPSTAQDAETTCFEMYGAASPGEPYQLANGNWMVIADDNTLGTAILLFDQGRYAESLQWFLDASKLKGNGYGGAKASLFLGKLYLEGLGDKCDPQEAVRWLKDAATQSFNPNLMTPLFDPDQPELNTDMGEAAVMLGNIYRNGSKGIARDPAESYRWYKRAYDVGHIPAAKTLGDLHLAGFGTQRSANQAVEWYEKAAKFGLGPAQMALGDLFSNDVEGLKRDRRMALKWYQAAAKRNHPGALFALARAYDFGDGVKADPQMALGLYKTAALNGSAQAKTALGTYFHEGRMVAQNDAIARSWFQRAAAERDAEGMFNLAAMMANGQGGERDLTSAYMWLQQASATGHEKAPIALAALERRMTPAERAAALRQPK